MLIITTKLKKEHLFHFIESQSFTMSFPFSLEINSLESIYNANNHNKIEERTSFPFHRITKLCNVFPLFFLSSLLYLLYLPNKLAETYR